VGLVRGAWTVFRGKLPHLYRVGEMARVVDWLLNLASCSLGLDGLESAVVVYLLLFRTFRLLPVAHSRKLGNWRLFNHFALRNLLQIVTRGVLFLGLLRLCFLRAVKRLGQLLDEQLRVFVDRPWLTGLSFMGLVLRAWNLHVRLLPWRVVGYLFAHVSDNRFYHRSLNWRIFVNVFRGRKSGKYILDQFLVHDLSHVRLRWDERSLRSFLNFRRLLFRTGHFLSLSKFS